MSGPAQTPAPRRFPYPYRAALALCSDIDECDRPTFLAVHRLINDDLGLPVADTFFGRGLFPKQMAYFQPGRLDPSADAPLIRAAIADGLIDGLHGWGDFNDGPPDGDFLRRMAERLTADLAADGLSVPLFINHGAPSNRQNMTARLQPGYEGDDPASPWYTADMLDDLGVRYIWNSELAPRPLSPASSALRRRRLAVNGLKNLVKRASGRSGRVRDGRRSVDLAYPLTLKNGRAYLGFTRYTPDLDEFTHPAERHNLHRALAPNRLDQLEAEEAYLVVYTHLGSAQYRDRELFFDADRRALEGLARRFHDGRVFMAASAGLLDYWRAWHYLDYTVYQSEGGWVIDVAGVNDPVDPDRPTTETDLAGLTFYTPRPEATRLRFRGRDLDAAAHPPDATGRASIGLAPPPAPKTDCLHDYQ